MKNKTRKSGYETTTDVSKFIVRQQEFIKFQQGWLEQTMKRQQKLVKEYELHMSAFISLIEVGSLEATEK